MSPHFFIEGGDPALDRLPLSHTSVRFNITGVIADVTVTQLYENTGDRAIDVRYVMPGDRIEVELRYNELLVPEGGGVVLVLGRGAPSGGEGRDR